jgi:MFS transporter, OFA family, oxalate/formate antiporter
LPQLLNARLPFFYGWVVLACLCCAGFARQGGATATFSVFVEPLTREFGWSRTAISGAASLGGVLAALLSPLIGPLLDRHGSRVALSLAVLGTGIAVLLLSLTQSLLVFYLLFCIARLNWASPFELGIYSTLNNWFVARRPLANSIATVAQMAGLVAMPLVAQLAMRGHSWRAGWIAIGATVLAVGFVPVWLFMVRRPEDLGLLPDRAAALPTTAQWHAPAGPIEARFSRRQAVRTPAFWLLLGYTVLVYPVQAGVSLHQAANLIEHGVAPTMAASTVSLFSLMSGVASAACGFMPRWLPIRYPMALGGIFLTVGCLTMIGITSPLQGVVAAALFGIGIGGMLTLLPVAWADYFGRANYGAIRGLALSAQVLAQAAGPLLSGVLRDWTGSYTRSLECFAALSALSILAAWAARQPRAAPP